MSPRSLNAMRVAIVSIVTLVSAVISSGSAAAASIVIPQNGTDFFYPFGDPETPQYGQTFVTPSSTDVILDNFSFWLDDELKSFNPDTVDFFASIYAWNGTAPTGAALYTSPTRTTTNNGGAGGYERFDFITGGVLLVDGVSYVALLNAVNDGIQSGAYMPGNRTNPYAGGTFVFKSMFIPSWIEMEQEDARFEANFSAVPSGPVPVPEPASILLLGSGVATVAARVRRLRRSRR